MADDTTGTFLELTGAARAVLQADCGAPALFVNAATSLAEESEPPLQWRSGTFVSTMTSRRKDGTTVFAVTSDKVETRRETDK
jgi:hypothetical protein